MWERRWHPLRQEWILYATHRNSRPWTTGATTVVEPEGAVHDPTCYLCPGNTRIHGETNPDYPGVYLFDNDHPMVALSAPDVDHAGPGPAYRRGSAKGLSQVICYHPDHNRRMSALSQEQIAAVCRGWVSITRRMADTPGIVSTIIFENNGREVGVSNPHPHGQAYGVDFEFDDVRKSRLACKAYRQEHGRDLMADILASELEGPRVVIHQDHWVAFVPWFATYAYELMVMPLKRHATLLTLSEEEIDDLALMMQRVTRTYDSLMGVPFPYSLSWKQAPLHDPAPEWHLYAWFLPPLRRPGLAKLMGGPELSERNFMADTSPEEKAIELIQTYERLPPIQAISHSTPQPVKVG